MSEHQAKFPEELHDPFGDECKRGNCPIGRRRAHRPAVYGHQHAGWASGLDGLELARRAVEFSPDLRVIYTTGGALTAGMTALFVDGATFLRKPYTRQELIQAVQGEQRN